MSKLNAFLLILLVIVCSIIVWVQRHKPAPRSPVADASQTRSLGPAKLEAAPTETEEPAVEIQTDDVPLASSGRKKPKHLTLSYTMSDGIAVVQGDVAIGKPVGEAPESGIAAVPPLKTWIKKVIPYAIEPDVPNPERVQQAIAMFERTAVRFVPHTDEEDALVFETANGICKSYAGRIGGLQPIWIPSDCGPREIAHEIMHALGFIHEQNRSDRDDFITVLFGNIDDQYRDNFEKLPQEYMTITGLAPFDFESLMIYPVWMFVKGGQVTMESKVKDRSIQPGDTLSASDIQRINAAFANLPN